MNFLFSFKLINTQGKLISVPNIDELEKALLVILKRFSAGRDDKFQRLQGVRVRPSDRPDGATLRDRGGSREDVLGHLQTVLPAGCYQMSWEQVSQTSANSSTSWMSSDVQRTGELDICKQFYQLDVIRCPENRWVRHMSQRMTFLYSPRLGNWSSRPVTKPTAMLSKAWRPCGMPNLDRAVAPTTGAGGYNFISARMRGKALRNDPIKGGILASGSQSALDSWVVHNPGPSWDFCPGLCLACSPLQGEIIIAFIVYLSVVNGSGESNFTCYVTACNRSRRFCVS